MINIHYKFIQFLLILTAILICILLIFDINKYLKIENFNSDFDEETFLKIYNQPKIKETILNSYIEKINEKIVEKDNIKKKFSEYNNILKEIDRKNNDYKKLKEEINKLNQRYSMNKTSIDKLLLDSSIYKDYNKFNSQNKVLKSKLNKYKNLFTQNETEEKKYDNSIKILKNETNNHELMIKNISGTKNIMKNQNIYFLVINNACLKTLRNKEYNILSCQYDESFYYKLIEIKSITMYNMYIFNDNKVKLDDAEIKKELPFFLLVPFKMSNSAVSYNDYKVSVKPITNNPYQRFKITDHSTACE